MLEIQGLTKQFPGVKALNNVHMHVNKNEIVGLVGENGAGKSTILNALSGTIDRWTGEILLGGKSIRPRDYHEATLLGIARVFQEQALVPTITVYENMFLTHEDRFRRAGMFLDKKQMATLARKECRDAGLDIDVNQLSGDYDFPTRQAIEIAKACSICGLLGIRTPLILLDEPTAALTQQEIEVFFVRLRQLKSRASVFFVSHRLSEVLELSDRVYVLKDGEVVNEVLPEEVDEGVLHELMVGRKRDQDYYREDAQREPDPEPILTVTGFSKDRMFENVCLDVRPGEILGIGGVLGSGKAALGRTIAGITAKDAGELIYEGQLISNISLLDLMRKGFGYVPRERHQEGIILSLSVALNMTLPSVSVLARSILGFLNRPKEREIVDRFIKILDIKTPSAFTLAKNLSGGNQQKVVLAKWLARQPKVLILDNPTRGVDAGAKEEIYTLLRELARQSVAIILITDELLELIGMSNRILIMKDGVVTQKVSAPPESKPTESELVRYMV